MIIIIFDYIKQFNTSVFKTINQKTLIVISISLIILMLFDIFNYDKIYNYNLFSEKQSCKNILTFFSEHKRLSNFIFTIFCSYSKILYYGLTIIVIFFLTTYKKIEIEKIFFLSAIFFVSLSIMHFSFDVYLTKASHYYQIDKKFLEMNEVTQALSKFYYIYKKYNSSNNYAYFQLLPFYSAGFRNVEIYPLLLGYLSSLYIMIKHNKKDNKYIFISSFLGLCLFLSFSRISWVISFFIILFFLTVDKKILSKYLLCQLLIFTIFTFMFTYIWNYSNIIFKKKDNISRSNFFYYTMMKTTSLINTDLSNYFNYLNKPAWYYYNLDRDSFAKIQEKGKEIQEEKGKEIQEEKEREFYEKNVKSYMQQHLNSTPSRIEIYNQAYQLIKEKFFFGHTVNRFGFALLTSDRNATIQEPLRTYSNAESDFLQTFIEHGVFVFLLKIFIYLYLLKIIIKQKDNFNFALIIMLFLFSIFVTVSFYFFYWITLGVIISRTLSYKPIHK